MLKKFLMATASAALVALGVAEASQAATIKVIADGLDSPRGLSFGPDGALYVVEAGSGGSGTCIPLPGGTTVLQCYGATGAITRIQNGTAKRVVTGLPSLSPSVNGFSYDVTGPHDIAFDSSGKAYVVVGLGSSPDLRDNTLGIPDFGQLIAINNLNGTGNTSWTRVADLAKYEGLYNPDNGGSGLPNPYNNPIDSNPYALAIQGNSAYIVDAAGNDFFQANTNGTGGISGLTLKSVFDARPVTDPATGNTIGMQAVPTSVTIGPDGAFYVGELTGYPFPENGASIFRIGSDNKPVVYANGFTEITDLAFDNKGGLYVLEYGIHSLLSGDPTGALIYVAPDGTRTTIASQELSNPTGLALGPDGTIYVSNNGFISGLGQVLSITVPEPNSTLSLIVFGTCGTLLWRLRKQKSASSVKSGD